MGQASGNSGECLGQSVRFKIKSEFQIVGNFIPGKNALVISVAVFFALVVRADIEVGGLDRPFFKSDGYEGFIQVLDVAYCALS